MHKVLLGRSENLLFGPPVRTGSFSAEPMRRISRPSCSCPQVGVETVKRMKTLRRWQMGALSLNGTVDGKLSAGASTCSTSCRWSSAPPHTLQEETSNKRHGTFEPNKTRTMRSTSTSTLKTNPEVILKYLQMWLCKHQRRNCSRLPSHISEAEGRDVAQQARMPLAAAHTNQCWQGMNPAAPAFLHPPMHNDAKTWTQLGHISRRHTHKFETFQENLERIQRQLYAFFLYNYSLWGNCGMATLLILVYWSKQTCGWWLVPREAH